MSGYSPYHYGEHEQSFGSFGSKKKKSVKHVKAPGAPKRFKSAYMFFSIAKHKEIRENLGEKSATEKTTNIAKQISKAWKDQSDEERKVWEDMARADKARYDIEKDTYTGPWKVAVVRERPMRDPTAPKKPMSSFLAFSSSKRAEARRANPDASNTDLSKILGEMWNSAPDDERRAFIDEERKEREKYKVALETWKEEDKQKKEKEQTELEEERQRLCLVADSVSNSLPTGFGGNRFEENHGTLLHPSMMEQERTSWLAGMHQRPLLTGVSETNLRPPPSTFAGDNWPAGQSGMHKRPLLPGVSETNLQPPPSTFAGNNWPAAQSSILHPYPLTTPTAAESPSTRDPLLFPSNYQQHSAQPPVAMELQQYEQQMPWNQLLMQSPALQNAYVITPHASFPLPQGFEVSTTQENGSNWPANEPIEQGTMSPQVQQQFLSSHPPPDAQPDGATS